MFRPGVPQDNLPIYQQVLQSIFHTTTIWLGCMEIVRFLWLKYPWEHYPVKHLILEVIMILTFTNVFTLTLHIIELKLGLIAKTPKIKDWLDRKELNSAI